MKKLLGTLLALLMVTALILSAACTVNYKEITQEEFTYLNDNIYNIKWPEYHYEMTYTLQSTDTELSNGIKSIKLTYLYKRIFLTETTAVVDEHAVIELTTTDASYKTEYWYLTSDMNNDNHYAYTRMTNGKESINIKCTVFELGTWVYYEPLEIWREQWQMSANVFHQIARRQFDNMFYSINNFISPAKPEKPIGKSGNNYKFTQSEKDTLEYYYFTLKDLQVTSMEMEQTGVDGTITCNVKPSDKGVTLPDWTSDENAYYQM